MHGNSSKFRAAAQRSAERRKREDDAPRLASKVPSLTGLRIEVVENVPNGTTKHVRLVVVARAPALFVVACGDPTCVEGGHDVTYEVMSALRGQLATFAGESSCEGRTGTAPCTRTISYRIWAEYAGASRR